VNCLLRFLTSGCFSPESGGHGRIEPDDGVGSDVVDSVRVQVQFGFQGLLVRVVAEQHAAVFRGFLSGDFEVSPGERVLEPLDVGGALGSDVRLGCRVGDGDDKHSGFLLDK
jgi:hypothetical protein